MGLRQSIQQQFELASLPGTSEADMAQVLHFVVVGGGPTGASTVYCLLYEVLQPCVHGCATSAHH